MTKVIPDEKIEAAAEVIYKAVPQVRYIVQIGEQVEYINLAVVIDQELLKKEDIEKCINAAGDATIQIQEQVLIVPYTLDEWMLKERAT